MNHKEVTQYGIDGIGVIEGADLAFNMSTEAPCVECGSMVSLLSLITVQIVNTDGTETEEKMTEADARQLLTEVGIPQPPVMCDRHGYIEVTTYA